MARAPSKGKKRAPSAAKKKRSRAAKKGWETRRRNQREKLAEAKREVRRLKAELQKADRYRRTRALGKIALHPGAAVRRAYEEGDDQALERFRGLLFRAEPHLVEDPEAFSALLQEQGIMPFGDAMKLFYYGGIG